MLALPSSHKFSYLPTVFSLYPFACVPQSNSRQKHVRLHLCSTIYTRYSDLAFFLLLKYILKIKSFITAKRTVKSYRIESVVILKNRVFWRLLLRFLLFASCIDLSTSHHYRGHLKSATFSQARGVVSTLSISTHLYLSLLT